MKKERFTVTEELVGKYLNYYLWTDVNPIGKIVAIKGKTKVIVQPVVASENLTKMEYVVGGFAGHCVNQWDQRYEFTEQGEVFEMTLSNSKLKRSLKIDNHPRKYYDFNF